MKTHTKINGRNTKNTFGGVINLSDFNTNHVGNYTNSSSIALNIVRDFAFDRQCKLEIAARNRAKAYKRSVTA